MFDMIRMTDVSPVVSEDFNANDSNSERGIPWLNIVMAILGLVFCLGYSFGFYNAIKIHHADIADIDVPCLIASFMFIVCYTIVFHVIYNIFNNPIDFYWYDIIIYLIPMIIAQLFPRNKYSFFRFCVICLSILSLFIYHFWYKVGPYAHDGNIANVIIVVFGLIGVSLILYIFILDGKKHGWLSDIFSWYFLIYFILYSIVFIHIIYNIFNDPIDFYWYDIIIYPISMMLPFVWLLIIIYICNFYSISLDGMALKMPPFVTLFVIIALLYVYHFWYKVGLYAHDVIEYEL
jgi:hypothetical protein